MRLVIRPLDKGETAWRSHHRLMLVIAVLAIGASFLLSPPDETSSDAIRFGSVSLPALCVSREWFGTTCPGCGLTRSFVHLAHGDWDASRRAHALGWVVAFLVLAQVPYRLHALLRPGHLLISRRTGQALGYGLICMLVIHWGLERLMAWEG